MNIEEKVKKILCELSGEQTVENDSLLEGDLVLDSLSMVSMLVQIEETFNIELDASDMNPFDLSTVQNVIDMVIKYVSVGDENE